ncbi:MAG: cytochrome b561 domain-containing protein [Pseudomonadota bacterium]
MTACSLHGPRSDHSKVDSARLLLLTIGFCFLPALAIAADQDAGALSWLNEPIDSTRPHDIDAATSWHGRLMVLAWAFLFPVGILAARFFKVMPGQNWPHVLDNKRWWHTHLFSQYSGGILVVIALGLGLYATSTGENDAIDLHHILGWIVIVFAAFQFLGGWLRGTKGGPTDPGPDGALHGDHYDMTRRRRLFEYAHKSGGYIALFTACAAVLTGLYAANAPRWMWLGLAGWWCLLISLATWLQANGFARDTYEAIWGPDKSHPGNHMRPIGIGVTRRRTPNRPD